MTKIEPFEKYSDKYEAWFEKNSLAYQSELMAVKEQLPKRGDGIEIGVGSGRFAEPLGIKVGIEPSKKMRKLAQKRGIEVIDAKAEKLPFNDSRFDFALMVTTICFVDDIKKTFKEVYRIVKPSGKLIIGFVDKDSSLGRFYQKNKVKSVFYKSTRFFSVDEVVSHLQEAGFNNFMFSQTLFNDLDEIKNVEPVMDGYGKGAFVVVTAQKGE